VSNAPIQRRGALVLLLAALILVGCGGKPAPQPAGVYRDTTALIGATSRYDAARFAGVWQVRAAYPGDESLRAVALIDRGGPVFQHAVRACPAGGDCQDLGHLWRASVEGPGRYTVKDPQTGADRKLWVLWVDEGFRTAVVGTPDGRFGWILDRNTSGGADRITAAREILDFNGYDLSQLQVRQ
tara:strand:- start:16655 stop:17206 length:552 start_codon:yes stop_codon:yes gene_type:complete